MTDLVQLKETLKSHFRWDEKQYAEHFKAAKDRLDLIVQRPKKEELAPFATFLD
jgi:hypothetical protein